MQTTFGDLKFLPDTSGETMWTWKAWHMVDMLDIVNNMAIVDSKD